MYLAKFALDGGERVVAALRWRVSEGPLVPAAWLQSLSRRSDVERSLRVTLGPTTAEGLLLASAPARAQGQVVALAQQLRDSGAPSECLEPRNSVEFDAMTGGVPAWQVRVNHRQYNHDGHVLACKFRLYAAVSHRPRQGSMVYQVNLKRHSPDAQTERHVLKRLAWLDIEQPFTRAVRDTQRELLGGLRKPGWRAAEFLALPDDIAGEEWLHAVQSHFRETTGSMGFVDTPLERGDFSDWLATGLNPGPETDDPRYLSADGATLFGDDELPYLLSGAFLPLTTDDTTSIADAPSGRRPQVFISYASDNFVQALGTCRALEAAGWRCWIAPRDIERTALPYPEAIRQSLAQVQVLVVLFSAATNLSVHVPRELDRALARKLPIIPIRLQAVVPSGQLDYLLSTCQWLNAFDRDLDSAMTELLARLETLRTSV